MPARLWTAFPTRPLEDRYFPEWTAFLGGARESLQNGYLSVALGLGIPAFIFWLFIYLMPWVSLFREQIDPWGLKPLFFLLVFPGLVYAFSESGIAEPAGNLLPFLCWMLAERFRLATRANTALRAIQLANCLRRREFPTSVRSVTSSGDFTVEHKPCRRTGG